MAGSVNVGMFIAFRFVAGAAAFMSLAAVPILMNEIVPVHIRGALVDVHAVMLVVGYTIQGKTDYLPTTLPHRTYVLVRLGGVWLLLLAIRLQYVATTDRHSVLLASLSPGRPVLRARISEMACHAGEEC